MIMVGREFTVLLHAPTFIDQGHYYYHQHINNLYVYNYYSWCQLNSNNSIIQSASMQ